MERPRFLSLSVNGHLGCFHLLSQVMLPSTQAYACLFQSVSHSWACAPGRSLVVGSFCVSLCEGSWPFSIAAAPRYVATAKHPGSASPHPPATCSVLCFGDSHPNGGKQPIGFESGLALAWVRFSEKGCGNFDTQEQARPLLASGRDRDGARVSLPGACRVLPGGSESPRL